MNYGLYLSASALHTNQQHQDVLANNLANVNTTAFKPDLAIIRSRPNPAAEWNLPPRMAEPVLDRLAGGLRTGGSYTDFTQGPILTSDNPYDLALEGEGFLAVQTDDGVRYTRDGRLARSTEGLLVTATDHHPVLDDAGKTIALPPGGELFVSPEGTLSSGGMTTQLRLVRFEEPANLLKEGGNLYRPAEAMAEQPAALTVRQRATEGSGVDPTRSLVNLLTVQRAYEASARMIQMTDGMLGRAVNDIARIG